MTAKDYLDPKGRVLRSRVEGSSCRSRNGLTVAGFGGVSSFGWDEAGTRNSPFICHVNLVAILIGATLSAIR